MPHAFIGEQMLGDNLVYCERCGEYHQTIQLAEIGLCDDCFAETMQSELTKLLGYKPCATAVWTSDGAPAVCLQEFGIEHSH